MNLPALFDLSFNHRAAAPALESGGSTFTFSELDRRSNRLARELRIGLLCALGFDRFTMLFPLPILGVILSIEAWTLATRVRDVAANRLNLGIALTVALAAVGLPYGFLIGMGIGIALDMAARAISSSSVTLGQKKLCR